MLFFREPVISGEKILIHIKNFDEALFAENVWLYPAKDMLFYAADVQGSVTAKARLSVVRQLAEYREKTKEARAAACG